MTNDRDILNVKFYCSSRIYKKEFTNSWLFFSPDYEGMPVVLDEESYAIFNHFTEGSTINDFITSFRHKQFNQNKDSAFLVERFFFLIKQGFLRQRPDPNFYPACDFPDFNKIKSLVLWIHITNQCNLNCKYCYIHKTSSAMNAETMKLVIASIVNTIKSRGIENITLKFAGGEPTLVLDKMKLFHKMFISSLEKAQLKTKIKLHILSNGTFIHDELIHFLKTNQVGIEISLDGYGEIGHDFYRRFKSNGKGSWEIITNNIDKLLANNIRPYILGTVSHRSSASLPDLAAWIIEKKLSTRLSIVRSKTELDEIDEQDFAKAKKCYINNLINAFEKMFVELEKEHYVFDASNQFSICDLRFRYPSRTFCCGIGTNHIVINEKGQLANCPMSVNEAKVDLGEDLLISIRKTVSFSPASREPNHKCLHCKWFPVCGGGCPIYNQAIYGDHLTVPILCDFYSYVIPRYVDFVGKKTLQNNKKSAL
jgi:uncharacterized protein